MTPVRAALRRSGSRRSPRAIRRHADGSASPLSAHAADAAAAVRPAVVARVRPAIAGIARVRSSITTVRPAVAEIAAVGTRSLARGGGPHPLTARLTAMVPGSVARILPDGLAAAPAGAPLAVKQAIWAANQLIGLPYLYGGGHGSFISDGYDCSGTVSFALRGGDLISAPLDSVEMMDWGRGGRGRWITIYANAAHAFVEIAGIRLDTSTAGDPNGRQGPRWRRVLSSTAGYVARHPAGY